MYITPQRLPVHRSGTFQSSSCTELLAPLVGYSELSNAAATTATTANTDLPAVNVMLAEWLATAGGADSGQQAAS